MTDDEWAEVVTEAARYAVREVARGDALEWDELAAHAVAHAWEPRKRAQHDATGCDGRGTGRREACCGYLYNLLRNAARDALKKDPKSARKTHSFVPVDPAGMDGRAGCDELGEGHAAPFSLSSAVLREATPDHVEELERVSLLAELRADVARALAPLPQEVRRLVWERHVEEFPMRDVAQDLNIPERTAYYREKRALKQLKRELVEWPGRLGWRF